MQYTKIFLHAHGLLSIKRILSWKKVCSLKQKTGTPLASNLSKTTTSFLDTQAKPKNIVSLLLNLILEKISVSINLQAEFDRLIYVSLNTLMS